MPTAIPRLVVELFQHPWFQGRRGAVIEPVPDTRAIGFHDTISSVRVYKGPAYGAGTNYKAVFHEHRDFKGRRLVLGPGYYHDLHSVSYNFGNIISSITFAAESRVDGPFWGSVPVVLELYDQPNYRGTRVTVVRDESRLDTRASNVVQSMRLFKGPNCPPMGCRVHFFERPYFEGLAYPIPLTRRDTVREFPDLDSLPQRLPTTIGSVKIEGWTSSSEFTVVVLQDEFDGVRLREGWEWVDPKGGGTWTEKQGWLEMKAEPGQYLWRGGNYDAPRLVRIERGDFAIETRLRIGAEANPYGGLLVWHNERSFLRLDKTSPHHAFRGDVRFEQHALGDDPLVGRGAGLEQSPELHLRIERLGNLFSAFASGNGVDWVSCGSIFVGMPDAVHVGIFGGCPDDVPTTTTRFDHFKVKKRPADVPLASSRLPAPYRTPDRIRRVDTLRKLT
jgi:hypothetical protein